VTVTDLTARHYQTGAWVRLSLNGDRITTVEPIEGPAAVEPTDDWIAPAFWDIQTNGRWGVSYADATLTPDQVAEIVRAQAFLGTARCCPTLITAPFESLKAALGALDAACNRDEDIARRVLGIHLEGPYISHVDGYRGAHPLEDARDPNWDEFQKLQESAGGRIVLMTLAPERTEALPFIRRLVDSGVTVALGHTAADAETLRAAADAGATLSTHLGNGIVSPLPRHPNAIFEQGALDSLTASFIADGHHVDRATLRVLVRAKTPSRVILVSDHSPLAGLPTGVYGPWAVHPSGKIVVAGTPYLAGSNQNLDTGLNFLMSAADLTAAAALDTVTTNPALLLGRKAPTLAPGARADLIRFRLEPSTEGSSRFLLISTCVLGKWYEADDAPKPVAIQPPQPAETMQ
jgi:N-acetylglucosamine-6-phosphate deacetylase